MSKDEASRPSNVYVSACPSSSIAAGVFSITLRRLFSVYGNMGAWPGACDFTAFTDVARALLPDPCPSEYDAVARK